MLARAVLCRSSSLLPDSDATVFAMRWPKKAMLATGTLVEGGLPLSSTGTYTRQQCDALNKQRNIDAHQADRVTQAIMCDTQPAACSTEMLFVHEFYWDERRALQSDPRGSKCHRWKRDADWPTIEPILRRSDSPTPESILQLLKLLPNKTVWFHGDSITTQLCEASFCSLMREGAVQQPPFCTARPRHPLTPPCDDLIRLEREVGMQLRAAALPNGARLLCSAVGVYEPEKIAKILPHADVAMFNYGLHYHSESNFRASMSDLFGLLQRWARDAPGRVPLYREQSAQHFKGGAWKPGADRPPPGTPCACEQLSARRALDHTESVLSNQNVVFNVAASELAAAHGVGIVPFFNLTAGRHDMHRRHFCSFSNQRKTGSCCDCTHFCFTPLLWDSFFARLRRTVTAHPNYRGGLVAPATEGGAFLQFGGGGGGKRGGGKRRGRAARRQAARGPSGYVMPTSEGFGGGPDARRRAKRAGQLGRRGRGGKGRGRGRGRRAKRAARAAGGKDADAVYVEPHAP